jgi:hypothetical protein
MPHSGCRIDEGLVRARPLVLSLSFAAAASVASVAHALPKRSGKGGDLGLGATIGDPAGATFKAFVHPQHALEVGAGFGVFHLGAGRLHFAYQFHSRPMTSTDEFDLLGYLGVGVGVAVWAKRYIGLGGVDDFKHVAFFFRAPVLGLAFHMKKLPIDVFLETAYSPLCGPPITWWNVDFALGVRYWF